MAAALVVTGAAGFVGRRTLAAGIESGADVVGLIRACEPAPDVPDARVVTVDWSSAASLSAALAELRPATVIHCAGHNGRFSGAPDLEALYEANVASVWRLLEALRRSGLPARVVLLSSAAVYDPGAPAPVAEDAPLAPAAHYGSSKLVAERVAQAFRDHDGRPLIVGRPFNVLGPREPPGSVTSELATQALAAARGARVTVRLRETVSVRDFVDVDDVARALVVLADRGEAGRSYNICRGQAVAIDELVRHAARVWDRAIDLEVARPDARGTVSVGDAGRLRALGWQPRHDLDDILLRIAGGQR